MFTSNLVNRFMIFYFYFIFSYRFSGVTEKHLRNVDVTLKRVQKKLLRLFGTDTILLGHSLESDMRALKVGKIILTRHLPAAYSFRKIHRRV